MRLRHLTSRAMLLAACLACEAPAPGGGAPAGCAPGAACDMSFETGAAEAPLDVVAGDPGLGRGACVLDALDVETAEGVRLRTQADTCLAAADGDGVDPGWSLGVDDAGGPGAQRAGRAFDGVVRVWAGSTDDPYVVRFDPPAELALELYDDRRDGVWAAYLIVDEEAIAIDAPQGAGGARTAVFLGAVPPVHGGPETLPLESTGIVGFVFFPDPARTAAVPSALGGAAGAATDAGVVSVQLPAAELASFPGVCMWDVIVPTTGQILAVGVPDEPLLPGESDSSTFDGRRYTAEFLPGGRLQVSSAFKNRLTIGVSLCIDPSQGVEMFLEAEGGSPNEEDRTGPYDGGIRVLLGGTNPDEMISLVRRLPRMVPEPARLRVVAAESFAAGFALHAVVFDHPESLRELVRHFPSDWRYDFFDRSLVGNVDAPLGDPLLIGEASAANSDLCGTQTCFDLQTLSAETGPLALDAAFDCSSASTYLDYGRVVVASGSGCRFGNGQGSGRWIDHVVIEPGDPDLDGSVARVGVRFLLTGLTNHLLCQTTPALTANYGGWVRIGDGPERLFRYEYPATTIELPPVVEGPVVLGRPFELRVTFFAGAFAVCFGVAGTQHAELTWDGIDFVELSDGTPVTEFFVRSASGTDWSEPWAGADVP